MSDFAYGQTVLLKRRVKTGTDDYGNDVYGVSVEAIYGVAVWPTGATESTGDNRDQLITGLTAILPPGINPAAIDRVTVYGTDYEIDGEPGRYLSPFTAYDLGTEVRLKRVTG